MPRATGIECPAWGPTYPQNTAQSAISRRRFSSASLPLAAHIIVITIQQALTMF